MKIVKKNKIVKKSALSVSEDRKVWPEGSFERKQGLERKLTKGHFKEDASSSSMMRFRVLLLARINVQA